MKFDSNRTWFIDTTCDPLYILAIKGHIPRLKVIRGQVVRWAQNVKFTSFEKLKSDWNQSWFIDVMYEPSNVHEVKGHRSILR